MSNTRTRASTPLDVLPTRRLATAAEAKEYRILGWSEKELQEHIIGLAKTLGWLCYHTYDSRRSTAGYPDLHLVHPRAGRHMIRELKTEKGRLSPAQRTWIEALERAAVDVAVWRPRDVVDRTVERQLRDGARVGGARA